MLVPPNEGGESVTETSDRDWQRSERTNEIAS